jgi:hypothetical protein
MEIIFFIISIMITTLIIWSIGRSVFDTNKQLIKAYETSEFLGLIHLIMGILLMSTLFITLCACNNTFWHLPYLITKQ